MCVCVCVLCVSVGNEIYIISLGIYMQSKNYPKGELYTGIFTLVYNREFPTECSIKTAIKYVNIFSIDIYWNLSAEQFFFFYNWDEKEFKQLSLAYVHSLVLFHP